MQRDMTFIAKRNNAQRFGIIRMMIFLRLITAYFTKTRSYLRESVSFYCVIQNCRCFVFLWVFFSVSSSNTQSLSFESYCVFILFIIFITTFFAVTIISIFAWLAFIKIRQRFALLAFLTGLCYDCFRHLLFLIKSNCLEPVTSTYLWPVRSILQHPFLMSRRNSHC